MKFTCGFKKACRKPAIWCVQKIGVGGSTVCQDHLESARKEYGLDAKVWRDDYFEHGQQLELDMRFQGEKNYTEVPCPGCGTHYYTKCVCNEPKVQP